jgi:hypothetical protein
MFDNFSLNSSVWIYTANKVLDSNQISLINKRLNEFIPKWAAHGSKLYGAHQVVENRFVILCVDGEQMAASGCSIDSSVKVIKEIGQEIGIDFFNRMNMIVNDNGTLKTAHISELNNFLDCKVYNPMISTLNELNDNWLIPVESSPFV